jgi:hypothetical protein
VVSGDRKQNPLLFHRVATVLVILGLVQSIVPSLFRIDRSTLSISSRHATPASDEARGSFLISQTLNVESRQENEADGETTDSSELLECILWQEGIAERRSDRLFDLSRSPDRLIEDQGRNVSELRRSWSRSTLGSSRESLPAKLCRFLC